MFKIIQYRLVLIIDSIINIHKSPYYGFIAGHSHLNNNQLKNIKSLINCETTTVVEEYEEKFSSIIGQGECISYAAGRMGFYEVMKFLNIGVTDEVILPGATCAVMANAILKTGATPIYSDIDPDTFGASPSEIANCITSATKLIVAQHSFGIPCDIKPIIELAHKNEIFVLEDCALTLGSTIDGVVCGNFGDASLFSTDHSKPLNTITGGMIYTKSKRLASSLRSSRDLCDELPNKKQQALWKRLLIEKKYCNAKNYGKMQIIDLFYTVCRNLFGLANPFLSDDFSSKAEMNEYSYPAKLPTFLAQLGLYQIERWKTVANYRKELFQNMLSIIKKCGIEEFLPASYSNQALDIVPLRFVWYETNGELRREKFSNFIHIDWTWFMKPIIAANEPLENYGYRYGMCSISEKTAVGMVNIPCNIHEEEEKKLLSKLDSALL
jgi:perosamine synthetase